MMSSFHSWGNYPKNITTFYPLPFTTIALFLSYLRLVVLDSEPSPLGSGLADSIPVALPLLRIPAAPKRMEAAFADNVSTKAAQHCYDVPKNHTTLTEADQQMQEEEFAFYYHSTTEHGDDNIWGLLSGVGGNIYEW